jgi:hypothetical protein
MIQKNPMTPKKTLLQLSATQRGVLDPIGRFSEIIFGLIMALTFTGSVSVGEGGEATVRGLLIAALGCNLAWGIVDAFMFVITRGVERARMQAIGNAIRAEPDVPMARMYAREALADPVNDLMSEEELDRLIEKVRQKPNPKRIPKVTSEDLLGALGVFLLVVVSTFPVALPFLFISKVHLAMRVSNGIAIVLMFVLGVSLARYSNQKSYTLGLAVVAVGVILVGLTMLLGG